VAPAKGFPLPAASLLAPPSWRTIVQFRDDGQPVATRLSGRGVLRPAKLLDFRTMPGIFPDVRQGERVAGYQIRDFRLQIGRPA